jgi:hypothetical protein
VTKAPDPTPVDPAVFDFLDTYFDEWQEDDEDDGSPPTPSSLSAFMHTFFRQFFESEWKVEITTIDQKAKVQATRIRLTPEDRNQETTRLIRSFEELCDRWSDVMGFHYSGELGDIKEFLGTFFPRLLGRIRGWADKAGSDSVQQRAAVALERLEELAL